MITGRINQFACLFLENGQKHFSSHLLNEVTLLEVASFDDLLFGSVEAK